MKLKSDKHDKYKDLGVSHYNELIDIIDIVNLWKFTRLEGAPTF